MKIMIKTRKEMLEDSEVQKYNNTLLKDHTESFLINSEMENTLCGKTFTVNTISGSKHWPFSIKTALGNNWIIPAFAVKEVKKD